MHFNVVLCTCAIMHNILSKLVYNLAIKICIRRLSNQHSRHIHSIKILNLYKKSSNLSRLRIVVSASLVEGLRT